MRYELPEGAVAKVTHRRVVRVNDEEHLLTRFEVGALFRNPDVVTPQTVQLSPTGGKTVVVVDLPNEKKLTVVATVHPRDHYNKKVGREVALGRAAKYLAYSDESRELVNQERARASLPSLEEELGVVSYGS